MVQEEETDKDNGRRSLLSHVQLLACLLGAVTRRRTSLAQSEQDLDYDKREWVLLRIPEGE